MRLQASRNVATIRNETVSLNQPTFSLHGIVARAAGMVSLNLPALGGHPVETGISDHADPLLRYRHQQLLVRRRRMVAEALGDQASETVIPQAIAWRLFTRGIDRDAALAGIHVSGDEALGLHVLAALAIVG